MNRLACIGLVVGAALTVAGSAFAQYRGDVREDDRVRPRWNQLGSAVCPNGYDFHRGWCRPRDGERLPPQWNSQGSAVMSPVLRLSSRQMPSTWPTLRMALASPDVNTAMARRRNTAMAGPRWCRRAGAGWGRR